MAPFRCCAALVLCSTASAFVARPLALLQGSGCTARGPGALGVQQPCRAVLTRRPARRRPLLHVLAYSKGGGPDGDSGGSPDAADPATVNFADGLREHLAGIWGPTGGEDFSLYSPDVEFKDPLASYRGIDTYKQALLLLKDSKISSGVQFQTHDVSIAGKGNVRARWYAFRVRGQHSAGCGFRAQRVGLAQPNALRRPASSRDKNRACSYASRVLRLSPLLATWYACCWSRDEDSLACTGIGTATLMVRAGPGTRRTECY